MGALCQLLVLAFVGLFLQTESKGITLIEVLKLADADDTEIADITRTLQELKLSEDVLYDDIDLGEIDPSELLEKCSHGQCEFCTKTKWFKACVKAELLPKRIGFRVALTVNGHNIFSKEISVANPPPLCVNNVPGLKWIANLCLEVYNVNLKEKSACLRLSFKVKLLHKKFSIKIKCFKFAKEDAQMIEEDNVEPAETTFDLTTTDLELPQSELDLTPSDVSDLLTQPKNGTVKFCVKVAGIPACIIASVLSSKIGFRVTLTVKGRQILKTDITVPNPKPLCLKQTPIKQVTNLCLSLDKVNLQKLSGCAKVSFNAKLGPVAKKYSFSKCFSIKIDETEYEYTVVEAEGFRNEVDGGYVVTDDVEENVESEALEVLKFISNNSL